MKISTLVEALQGMQTAHGDAVCISVRLDENGKEVTDGLCVGTGLGLDGEIYIVIMSREVAETYENEETGGDLN